MTRRARIATTHGDGATAERVAAALRPDNTTEMETRVSEDRVVTTVERETTGGLQSTVDDYVVNCSVAAQLTTDPDTAPDSVDRSRPETDDADADGDGSHTTQS